MKNLGLNRRDITILGIIAGIVLVLSIPQIEMPLGRDQGIFAYHGFGLINGLVPYIDMWDHKPPGIYYLYTLALRLFGMKYSSINMFDILWRVGTCIAMFYLGRRLYSRNEGYLAALIYGMTATVMAGTFWWVAQAEGFMVLPLTLSVFFLLDKKGRMGSRILAGAMAGAAITLKTTAMLHLIFLYFAVFYLIKDKTWEPNPRYGRFLGFTYGLVSSLVPTLLYFSLTGALPELIRDVFVFNLYHSTVGGDISLFFENGVKLTSRLLLPAAFALIYGIARKKPDSRLMLIWLAFSVTEILIQRKFFFYHFFIVLAPLVPLSARGVVLFYDWCAKGISRYAPTDKKAIAAFSKALIVILLVVYGIWYWGIYVLYQINYRNFTYLQGKIHERQYYSRFQDQSGDFSFMDDMDAAHYITANSRPGARILVFGFEPLVNFLAGRIAPTRFNSDYPLTFTPNNKVSTSLRERNRKIFIEELVESPPALILVATRDINALETTSSDNQLKDFPEFIEFMESRYKETAKVGDFIVFRKREL